MLSISTPALADLEAAQRAFDAQDYETAYREAQPFAAQGDAYAQRIVKLAKMMIGLKRLRDEHLAATGPIDLRDYDGRYRSERPERDQARFDKGQRHHDSEEYEAAYAEWLPLAEAGDAEALYWIGLLHLAGEGVAEDREMAANYLLRSAELGYGRAQAALPLLLEILLSDDAADQREAFYWVLRAAINGEDETYFIVSNAYCKGKGTDKNPVLADIWLYLAHPAKEDFFEHRCNIDVEFPTSYYEAIAERAKAMMNAYDIPIARTVGSDPGGNAGDEVE